ncbi:MAG: tetratricopeptide repeat protein [Acidobacteriota bacterium]
MKLGMVGVSLLICAALVFPVAAQTIPTPTERLTPQTVEAALAIEEPGARINALQQILKIRPATEQANAAREAIVASWAQLGEAQLGDNNIEKATVNFRKALTSLPEKVSDKFFAETVIRIPLAVSVRGYRNEAIDLARLLEKRFAKEVTRLAAMGEFFMTVEAPADAIRSLEAAAKLSDGSAGGEAPLHCALGAAYRMGLRLDDAIAEYQLAIGADPKDKRAYYELANLYRAHGAYADAVKLYQKQLEVEPKHVPALKGLALAYLAQGNEARMTAALNQARDLRGSAQEVNGDIYLQTQMAFYYLKQNKMKQARAAAEAALVVEPRYAWARIAAAEVDLADSKVFEAERNLLAAERYAGFPMLFFTFGKLYLSVDDFDGAMERFAKAFSFSVGVSSKDQFATRLGGSLDVKAEGVKELLAREHQASIFIAESPTPSEQFKMAESLVRFNGWLNDIKAITASKGTVTRKQMEELDRAALDFVEAESTRRSFRSLYVAQKLSQAGIATGLAVELAEQALGLAGAATEADGSVRDYPNYDRSGRLQVFRGRALDAKGWALYKAGQNDEAAAALSEAVKAYGSLPESKQALWHLAAVKEAMGDLNAALDFYLAGYQPPEASTADMKLAVIEVIYRKVNGSQNGLDERLRRALGATQTEVNAMLTLSSQSQLKAIPDRAAAPAKPQPKRARATEQISKRDSGESRDVLRPSEPAKPPAALPTTDAATSPNEQPIQTQATDITNIEIKEPVKESGTTIEAPPVSAKPVELPNISLFPDQPVLPVLLDPQTLLSPWENVKANTAIDEDVPPPPPAQTHTRPRRVAAPKDSTPTREQETSSPEPIRLRRPPKPNK